MIKLLCFWAILTAAVFVQPSFGSDVSSDVSNREIALPAEYRAFTKLREINQLQMQFSGIVLQRSSNQAVRQFASQVYSQYSYNDRELTQLSQALNMPLINYPMNDGEWTSMKGEYEKLLQLSILSGRQLDSQFVSLQVDYHRSSLSSIESYMNSSTNEYAKQYLTRSRDTMNRYYEQAQKLQTSYK